MYSTTKDRINNNFFSIVENTPSKKMDWTRGKTIGHGASAAVSIAVSNISGEVFAVKSVELARSEPLRREERILSSLNCPHVIGYIGSQISMENSTAVFNLMIEHADGGSLADAVRRGGGCLKEESLRRYARGVVEGLEYLHSRGIVHCDIKGSNILLVGGEAKIADFGCAKAAEEAAIGGTPLFMAPEVARGEEQGFPADIWALGCTVIEMATGKAPWPNSPATLYRIAFSGESPEIPESLSELGKDFLSKCLRVDCRERWTAEELLRHPFLDEFRPEKTIVDTNSPTSVLDHGIWSSIEEEFSSGPVEINFADFKKLNESCEDSTMEEWDFTASWVTVRDSKKVNFGIQCRLRCTETEFLLR